MNRSIEIGSTAKTAIAAFTAFLLKKGSPTRAMRNTHQGVQTNSTPPISAIARAFRAVPRDHRTLMVGGLVGLAVHVAEVAKRGWPQYPVLVALNLVLPATLALSAWAADRGSS